MGELMYYIIYMVTNLINGKQYYGKHATDDLNDDYIGTGGKHYQNAIKKYSKENFKKEIKMLCRSYDVMTEMEEYLSHIEDWINNPKCYNENYGGDGGWDAVNKRLKEDPEMNSKMRQTMSINRRGKKKSKLHKIAISLSNVGKHDHIGEKNPMYGKHHTNKTKQLQSDAKIGKNFCKWVTNGVDNKYILKNLPIPNEYYAGMTMKRDSLGRILRKSK